MNEGATTKRGKAKREEITATIGEILEGDTVLCIPTAGLSPRLVSSPKELDRFRMVTLALTCAGGLAGVPQVHIPLTEVSGGALGLSLVAWRNRDEALLSFAREISQGERGAA